MKATPDLVKSTIRTQDVDTLSAEDVNTGDRVGFCSGSKDELCAHIDELEASMLVPYRVRVWSSKVDRKRGNKPVQDKPFVWVLNGLAGYNATSRGTALVNGAPVAPAVAASPVPVELAERAAREGARAEYLEKQLDALRSEIAELREALDESETEADQLSEAVTAPAPVRWWETEAGAKAILETVKPLSEAAAAWIRPKIPANPQRVAAADPGPAEPVVGISDHERELIAAWRRFTEAHPDAATEYRATLVNNYGNPNPAANG
jgi:TolA-binding protein